MHVPRIMGRWVYHACVSSSLFLRLIMGLQTCHHRNGQGKPWRSLKLFINDPHLSYSSLNSIFSWHWRQPIIQCSMVNSLRVNQYIYAYPKMTYQSIYRFRHTPTPSFLETLSLHLRLKSQFGGNPPLAVKFHWRPDRRRHPKISRTSCFCRLMYS